MNGVNEESASARPVLQLKEMGKFFKRKKRRTCIKKQ